MTQQPISREARPARKVGYLVAVIVNVVLWLLVNVRPGWRELPFLTESFTEVVWLVNASIIVSAAVNAIYLVFDPAWFRSVGQILVLAVGLVASIRMWQVFPFDFSGSSFPWESVTRVMFAIAIFGSVVAIITELVNLARIPGGQVDPGARRHSLPRP